MFRDWCSALLDVNADCRNGLDQSLAFGCRLSVAPQDRGSGIHRPRRRRLWGKRQVSDSFLLNMAEVSGALVGLFLVGVFFFLEVSGGKIGQVSRSSGTYLRASTRIVLVLFAISLLLSLTLVVLEPVWNKLPFALLSLMLIAANLDTAIRIRAVARVSRSTALLVNEIVGTAVVLVIVVIPWILGTTQTAITRA